MLPRTTLCFPDSHLEPEAVGALDAAGGVLAAVAALRLDDPLDRYVEAHVHGGVETTAVAAMVLDPSFRGTDVEEAARTAGPPVRWHPGYVLDLRRRDDLDASRGAVVARAARVVVRDGLLTPALLGEARRTGRLDPDTAKRVWHLLARFGRAEH